MMNVSQIHINQTFASVGIDTQSAKFDLKSRQAELNLRQENTKVEINQSMSSVQIDQSDAFSALGQGSVIEVTDKIVGQMYQTGLNVIKNIAAKGKMFQDTHLHDNNLIAQFAKTDSVDLSAFQYASRASCSNVNVKAIPAELKMDWSGGEVDVEVQPNKTLLDYTRWNVDIYMDKKNSVEIITPKIDLTL